MTEILQVIFDALSLGSLYALGALGIALIFGVMRLVNFAHGDYIAFCVFAMLWPSIDAAAIVFAGNLPTVVLIPLILAIGAGLSVLSEILVFRRFRNANPATMAIGAPGRRLPPERQSAAPSRISTTTTIPMVTAEFGCPNQRTPAGSPSRTRGQEAITAR